MILYFSGEGSNSNPELVLGNKANIMLTYADYHGKKKLKKRFRKILKSRRKPKT